MSTVNDYGIVIDYKELVENLYDVGVSQCIDLSVAPSRTWTDINIRGSLHFRGKDYHVEVTVNTEGLRSDGVNYLHYVAKEIAHGMGKVLLLSNRRD